MLFLLLLLLFLHALSLGNHEFDNGVSGLTPFIKNLTCPVLAANLNLTEVPELQAETNLMNSVIFNISDVKVGVIGYLTPETKFLAIVNDVEYIEEVAALRLEVERLKRENCSILIALGHSGFSKDLEIAKNVEGIDLVIGGHTNTFLWNGTAPDTENPDGPYPTLVEQTSGRKVPVVQAYAYTKYLGKLHLVFDSLGEIISYNGAPILLDDSVLQDSDVLSIIDRYKDSVLKISDVVVGNTSVIFDFNDCKTKECNLGNMVSDAMVYKYASHYEGEGWTDAPISIIQRGGIRASIVHPTLHANVTYGDLLTVLPFDNKMVKLNAKGSVIINMLEYSVKDYNTHKSPGAFLHFSGMKVIYDFSQSPGRRVSSIKILCGKCDIPEYFILEDTKEYSILMTTFLAGGGDGYSMFPPLPFVTLPYSDLECATAYVRTHSPLYTAVDERMVLQNVDKISNSVGMRKVMNYFVIIVILGYLCR